VPEGGGRVLQDTKLAGLTRKSMHLRQSHSLFPSPWLILSSSRVRSRRLVIGEIPRKRVAPSELVEPPREGVPGRELRQKNFSLIAICGYMRIQMQDQTSYAGHSSPKRD
jgi:hypothetical protein